MNTSIIVVWWLVVFFGANPLTFVPAEDFDDYIFRTGWYNGATVKYVPFAASDLPVAKELDEFAYHSGSEAPVDWAPSLAGMLGADVFGEAYFINSMQKAVFSSQPGLLDYTPLWRVHVLEWRRGVLKTPLTSEAEVLAAVGDGRLVQVRPLSILDATIVQDTNGTVIGQAVEYERVGVDHGEIEFPVFRAFAPRTPHSNFSTALGSLITDSSDEALATQARANYAPRLANATADLCNPIYAFVNPSPIGQLPIINQAQTYRVFDYIQSNLNYNPIKYWTIIDRSALPDTSVVNNMRYADYLISRGVLLDVTGGIFVTNSPVQHPEDR